MSMKNKRGSLEVLLLISTVGLHLSLPVPLAAQTIKIGGTGGALGTMGILAEAFKKSHPDAKVIIVPGLSSGGGRKALLGGAIDIAVTSKPGRDAEKLDGAIAVLLGRTPFVFATSTKNTTSALTTEELVAIWNGKTPTWPDGSRLRLILRPETDSDTDVLKRISPAMEQAVKNALAREGMKITMTDTETADAIETIPGALGTSSLALIISEKRSLKALDLNGVTPSPKTIANGSYPHFRSIYALTGTKPSGLTEQFMAFLRSTPGHEILAQSGHWLGDGSPQK
jgi:phosphate transport system substrate-binding protein